MGVLAQQLISMSFITLLWGAASECSDNDQFKDHAGDACISWVGYDCSRSGFPADQEAALLANCKKSCDVCPTVANVAPVATTTTTMQTPPLPSSSQPCCDNKTFRDPYGDTCASWRGFDCKGSRLQADLLTNCRASCAAFVVCSSESCPPDDENFIDQEGYTCKSWTGYDCLLSGYQARNQKELLAKCMKACGLCPSIVCGESTVAGTSPQPCSDNDAFTDYDGDTCRYPSLLCLG